MDLANGHKRLVSLCQSQNFEDAVALAESLLTQHPHQPALWHLLACARVELKEMQKAETAFLRALELRPKDATILFNFGCLLQHGSQAERAVLAFKRAIELEPGHAAALNNLGNVLRDIGRLPEAIQSLERAVSVGGAKVEARYNLATALMMAGRLDEAMNACCDLLKKSPNHFAAQALMLRIKGQICDFTAFDDFKRNPDIGSFRGTPPFVMLGLEDHPARQLARSVAWSKNTLPKAASPLPAQTRKPLRIGYFSANFCEHPEMYLTAGLFRTHDPARFEVHAYSTRAHGPNEHKDHVQVQVAGFHEVHDRTDKDIATLARAHELDIAIDLNGHLRGARLGVFAERAAPIQITYLGYSGSVGAEFFDYMIADTHLIPAQMREHYTERLIFMPQSYMPTDDQEKRDWPIQRRVDHGLAEDAVVICCFNNGFKIGPQEFDIWMRVMRANETAVLWLRSANRWMEVNLRREAEARGIAGTRLVFADRVPRAVHLARHSLADVFADTFRYTAHSTAIDALWAGLPIVSKMGKQFAARVGCSLLNAVGLPELVTTSDAEYEDLLNTLVTNEAQRGELSEKLVQLRSRSSLFNTEKYTRAFEAGLEEAHALALQGALPRDIRVYSA